MSSMEIINNNIDELKKALPDQISRGLWSIGATAEGYAKSQLYDGHGLDTGRLRNSITHAEEANAVYIGTNVEYAVYVELGTGVYSSEGTGKQTPWSYIDEKGHWHTTKGMKPIHFLKNAVADHIDEYKKLLEDSLK